MTAAPILIVDDNATNLNLIRVLIIEGDAITRNMLRLTLEAGRYVVAEAPDAGSALRWAGDHPPDLILQDLVLPDMDGITLLARLRGLRHSATIPVICCSGLMT